MNNEELVNEMIEVAAIKANITNEQSLQCVRTALLYVQEKLVETGPIDLSSIGFYVAARSTASFVVNRRHQYLGRDMNVFGKTNWQKLW